MHQLSDMEALLMEVTCGACGGAGLFNVPKPDFDSSGNPIIVHEIQTCSACAGQGKVTV